MTGRQSLRDFSLNGSAPLEFILKASPYGSLEQTVASLALFTHPATVAQTQAQALFRIVRGPIPQRGAIVAFDDGRPVLLDDNTGPTDAFLWANGIRRGEYSDVQFCRVWQCSGDPLAYTNLANLCLLPAFLAKFSDTHIQITELLRRRAHALYGWHPVTESRPDGGREPDGLDWVPCLPPSESVEAAIRKEMHAKAKSRTTISASTIGWLFSGWEPDSSLPQAS